MLDYINDWLKKHISIERFLNNLELLSRLLDQRLIDFDEEKTSDEMCDVTIFTEQENANNNSKRGDCTRWMTKGQRSFGDSRAFKHEPNKTGKGMGRPRSPFPTGSPHRSQKSDGKSTDDGGAQGTPNFTGQTTLYKLQQRKLSERKCIFLNVQNSSLQQN